MVLESILNLGTRKAADWFKAELRLGGGLDRVADAAIDAVDYLADLDPGSRQRGRRRPNSVWRSSANPTGLDGFALDKLRRVCYYTKLLENVSTIHNGFVILLKSTSCGQRGIFCKFCIVICTYALGVIRYLLLSIIRCSIIG